MPGSRSIVVALKRGNTPRCRHQPQNQCELAEHTRKLPCRHTRARRVLVLATRHGSGANGKIYVPCYRMAVFTNERKANRGGAET